MTSSPPPLDPARFPVTARWRYLNHAGVGPLPDVAVEAVHRAAAAYGRDGDLAFEDEKARLDEVRAAGATVMGVPVDDVAFVKNTTEGLALVAAGLDLGPGDRVVLPGGEFPSTYFPWAALQERGVRVDLVEARAAGALPVDAFHDVIAAGPPPAVVVTSWVQYGTGYRVDLPALARTAHDAGALLCVDGIQGLGVLPAELEAWGVDFAAADGHKFLLAPAGAAVLYVRDSVRDRLRVLEPGWASVRQREVWHDLALDYADSARRFEGGSPNSVGLHGLGASLDLLLGVGVDAVWAHVATLVDRIVAACGAMGLPVLSDRTPEARSAIVVVGTPGVDPADVAAALTERGVRVAARGAGVRLSPHGYTTEDDVDAALDAVRAVVVGVG